MLWIEIGPFSGLVGYVITSWLLFVLIYATLVSLDQKRTTMRDRVAAVVVHSLAVVVIAALVFIILYTFFRARKALIHVNFYTQDLRTTGPLAPLTQGGLLHALAGTMIGMALTYLVPPLFALFGSPWAQLCGLAAWALMAISFQPVLRLYRLSPLWGVALPAISLAFMLYTLDSACQYAAGKGGSWKGRIQAKASQ